MHLVLFDKIPIKKYKSNYLQELKDKLKSPNNKAIKNILLFNSFTFSLINKNSIPFKKNKVPT